MYREINYLLFKEVLIVDRFEIFAILKCGTKNEKQNLRKQIGQEKWKENIQLWKSLGGKIELWMIN